MSWVNVLRSERRWQLLRIGSLRSPSTALRGRDGPEWVGGSHRGVTKPFAASGGCNFEEVQQFVHDASVDIANGIGRASISRTSFANASKTEGRLPFAIARHRDTLAEFLRHPGAPIDSALRSALRIARLARLEAGMQRGFLVADLVWRVLVQLLLAFGVMSVLRSSLRPSATRASESHGMIVCKRQRRPRPCATRTSSKEASKRRRLLVLAVPQ